MTEEGEGCLGVVEVGECVKEWGEFVESGAQERVD